MPLEGLRVTSHIVVPWTEFEWSFVRSGGPGGQNVNKVASKAVLRWNVVGSASLSAPIKARLLQQQAGRITLAGDLLISSQRSRDRERNRDDCLERLADMVRRASVAPRPRKATRPTRGSREARLQAKRRRSSVKSGRRRPATEG
jgi:ribosome-associated protein